MTATLIDGKEMAKQIRLEIKEALFRQKTQNLVPGLAVVLVGNDPASQTYVRNKEKACQEVGIYSEVHRLDASISEKALLALIEQLNKDPQIHGILVQLPLPAHIQEAQVFEAISPEKDVDGFHPINVGHLQLGRPVVVPCTPLGMMTLLERYDIPIAGKRAVVLGRSNIVGKPTAMLLLHANATVTICHSKTADLPAVTRGADILISAVGRAEMITAEMVKPGAVVLDVGMNRNGEGKLVGDVDFAPVAEKASFITPVPGGVGPMTIAMLLKNACTCAGMSTDPWQG